MKKYLAITILSIALAFTLISFAKAKQDKLEAADSEQKLETLIEQNETILEKLEQIEESLTEIKKELKIIKRRA